MRHMRMVIPAILILLSDPGTAWAADVRGLMEERFEPILQQTMRDKAIPGAAIAVVKDGAAAYVKAFGVKSLDTGEPCTVDSLFHMASVTKTFVATAIAQLWEQGKIDLEAPVVQYLPYFTLDDPRYAQITIGQMLNHTSGMPDVINYEWNRPAYDDGALEAYVRSLANRKLIAAPGSRQKYSNIAFEALGDVIAKVSGMTFEDYVEQHILKPLGMQNSTLMKPKADPAKLTTPHVRRRETVTVSKVFPYNRKHAPSSTLLSSAADMSRWILVNLNRGEIDGVHILQDATYDKLWRSKDPAFPGIGLSWFLGEHRGQKTVSHGGGDLGFSCYLLLLPEKALGVVVATNFEDAPALKLVLAAVDILLDSESDPTHSTPQP